MLPDFFGWLVEEVDRFWVDNILGKKEPEAKTVSDVLLKFNQHTGGKTIEVSDDIYEAYKSLKGVREEIKALEAREEELEGLIKLRFEDAEALTYGGQTIATWKASKASPKFDAKAFQAAHPDLAQEFTHVTQGARRFLLK